jgi:sugar phosphate isomerase/epimerase
MKIGATLIPLVGWAADPGEPAKERKRRLSALRRLVEEYGLKAVELTLDFGLLYPRVLDEAFYLQAAHLQEGLGFVCTVHLPLLWLDLSSLNELIRQTSVECVRRAVELVRPLQVESYVLHLWGFTTAQIYRVLTDERQRPMLLEAGMAQAGRSLAQIRTFIEPAKLCVENLEAPPFDLVLPLIEQQGVGICLDVGHLAWQGGGELAFLERHGERVREVHLHDAVHPSPAQGKRARDHLPLGQGELDHQALLRKLDEMGFDGCVIIENNSEADLRESLKELHSLV